MNFTEYKITAGKVFAVNPNRNPDPYNGYFDEIGKHSAFETWKSTQPEITADPSIKDGVYAKELLEIVWQYKQTASWGGSWTNCSDNNPEGAIERNWPVRLYLRLKQPVKHEEKELNYYADSDIIKANADDIPIKLKEWRLFRNLTLRQVEEKTGISNSHLSHIETGKIKNPPFRTILILCRLYRVKINLLY